VVDHLLSKPEPLKKSDYKKYFITDEEILKKKNEGI
jgi:hypothetical protein